MTKERIEELAGEIWGEIIKAGLSAYIKKTHCGPVMEIIIEKVRGEIEEGYRKRQEEFYSQFMELKKQARGLANPNKPMTTKEIIDEINKPG